MARIQDRHENLLGRHRVERRRPAPGSLHRQLRYRVQVVAPSLRAHAVLTAERWQLRGALQELLLARSKLDVGRAEAPSMSWASEVGAHLLGARSEGLSGPLRSPAN
eukprot:8335140-Pyramimonas_sp.AAC.1